MTTALLAVLLTAPAPSFAQSTATLKAVDLYRSDEVTVDQARDKVARLLGTYLQLRNDGRRSQLKQAERVKTEIENNLRSVGKLAFASMAYSEYVTSAEHTAYVTFDVVDAKDADSRMPFRKAPAGQVDDPAGLLAAWKQYNELGQKLSAQGSIPTDRPDCPAFYCAWGSPTPELAALEKRFVEEASKQKAGLRAAFEQDASPQDRAAALFVLSYVPEGVEVAQAALDGLKDPAAEVRAAALQILSDVSVYHKDVFLDVRQIIPALDFPTVSDRAKALGVLVGLADNPVYRPYVVSRAAPYLLRLLRLQQPSNHDLAFTLLGVLSKESYGSRDYDAWQRWVDGVQASTDTAK